VWSHTSYDVNDAMLTAPYYLANNPTSPDPSSPFYDANILLEEANALTYTANYHANTPSTVVSDNRGLALHTTTENKWYDDATSQVKTETNTTELAYDGLGRLVSTTDPRGLVMMTYTHGQFGATLHTHELDAGDTLLHSL